MEEICPRLASRGHEITLYCSGQVSTPEAVYKNTILRRTAAIPTKHLETLSRTFLSACLARFKDYDIVHFHSIGPALLSWMTKWNSNKTVVTVHGLDWQRAKWGRIARECLRVGESAAVKIPDRTIVISKHLKRYYEKEYQRDVVCIPNGVNAIAPLAPNFISQKWGLTKDSYILFASRLVQEKECHTLIEAFKTVQTDKKLVIAGSSWHSDQYVEELKKMAQGDSRILFTGWAEGDVMNELYSNAYVYCLPSTIEGLSLALLEAMSFGVCPLISNIPENTDVVEDCGVSFKTGDREDLAAKLRQLIQDPAATKELGLAAKRLVSLNYSWDRHCDEL